MPETANARRAVVRAHMHGTTTFLVADRPPCTHTRDKEFTATRPKRGPQPTGRVMVALDPAGLAALDLPRSWLVVVLLCPGDGTTEVAAFAKGLSPPDRERVVFYHHPDADLGAALKEWADSGLAPPPVEEAADFPELHSHLGGVINERIYQDHRE